MRYTLANAIEVGGHERRTQKAKEEESAEHHVDLLRESLLDLGAQEAKNTSQYAGGERRVSCCCCREQV
jgi:hypothetical protein